MRLIKNFLHNINDVVLAIVIVALAVGIIYWRMQIILDYPKQLVEEQSVQTQEEVPEEAPAAEASDEGDEQNASEDSGEPTQDEEPAESSQPAEEDGSAE